MECSEQESENSAWPKPVTFSFSLFLSHFMGISFFTNEKRELSNTLWGPSSSKVLWLIYLQPKRCFESGRYKITDDYEQRLTSKCKVIHAIWKYWGTSIFIIWEADWFRSDVIKINEICFLRSKRNSCYFF